VIANQRHRSTRLRSRERRLSKLIQPLEAPMAANLDLVSLGYDPHQFNDITAKKYTVTTNNNYDTA
jgi:hypothetical protein